MFADRYQIPITLRDTFSADGTRALGRAEGACIIKSVDVFNSTDLATHATNYVTLSLINLGTDATGTTVIASASTSQTGGSAMAENVAFPLTITAAAAAVADGETLGFVYDEATTAVADNQNLNVVVRYEQVGPTS